MSNPVAMDIRNNIVQARFRRSILARAFGRWSAWNKRRQAIQELRAMPDSLLADLGIDRYQIVDVVNRTGPFAQLHTNRINKAEVAPLHQAAA